MLLLNHHNTPDHSVRIVEVLSWVESAYSRTKNLLGDGLLFNTVFFVATTVASPILFANGLFMRRQRKLTIKALKKLQYTCIDTNGAYLKLKEMEAFFNEHTSRIEKLTMYPVANSPWLIRFMVSEVSALSKVILLMSDTVNDKLAAINQPKHKTPKNSTLVLSTEKDRWEARAKVYEYWI